MHDFTIAPQLTALAEIFSENGARLYAVGGMVRNCLLGYPVNDTDVCSALIIEDVEAMLTARGIEFRKKGAAFGTLDIVMGGMSFEYAAFRTERYDGTGSHRPSEVSFAATLEEDAFRRDFTVNAIYLDPLTKEVIDPTGGVKDMERRILRATSPNPALIMRDDGVRILRLCRFAGQLGFEADENTLAGDVKVCKAFEGHGVVLSIRERKTKKGRNDAPFGRRYYLADMTRTMSSTLLE